MPRTSPLGLSVKPGGRPGPGPIENTTGATPLIVEKLQPPGSPTCICPQPPPKNRKSLGCPKAAETTPNPASKRQIHLLHVIGAQDSTRGVPRRRKKLSPNSSVCRPLTPASSSRVVIHLLRRAPGGGAPALARSSLSESNRSPASRRKPNAGAIRISVPSAPGAAAPKPCPPTTPIPGPPKPFLAAPGSSPRCNRSRTPIRFARSPAAPLHPAARPR